MSSNLTHGMTVDEVESLGRLLQSKADQLRQLTSEVESALGRTVWDGPDASTFKQQWWPDHRGRLQAVAEQIHGFGQSALNNTTEQRQASGVIPGGGTPGASVVGGVAGGAVAAGAGAVGVAAGRSGPPAASGGQVGGSLGALSPAGGLDAYRQQAGLRPSSAEWAQGPPANGQADQWGKAANNCTSWVAFRRAQLGQAIPAGNGGAMGHDPNASPTLGAVVSYGSGFGKDYGHVMVVEEVFGPDRMRVSEMNFDGRGGHYDQRVWTRAPGTNTWQCTVPYSSTQTLKFTP